MKYTFTQIPDAWSDPNFPLIQRFIVARILRFEENRKDFFMKRKNFCAEIGIPPRTYDYHLDHLKNIGVIEVVKKTAKNISWLTINAYALELYIKEGFPTKKQGATMALELCNNGTATVQDWHSDSARMALLKCKNGTSQKTNKLADKGNIQDNIESNKQESDNTSFDYLREEVTPKDELEEFMDNLDI